MGLKMVSLLVLAMSALMIVASATTSTSTNNDNVGPDGVAECLMDLPGLKVCGRSVSDLFTRGKFSITHECCEAFGSAVRDCLDIVLKQYGITVDQLNLLLGICNLVPVPGATPPTVAPAAAPAPL